MKNINRIKNSFLEHIVIYYNSGFKPKSLLRSFVDNWYAYDKACNGIPYFLNSNGNPIWFNNPHSVKHKNALLEMDFISEGAKELIFSTNKSKLHENKDSRLIKEHAIPIAYLFDLLAKEADLNTESVEAILLKYYKLGVLTKAEDDLLNKAKIRSKMPSNWDKENVFSRYDVIGLKNQKSVC